MTDTYWSMFFDFNFHGSVVGVFCACLSEKEIVHGSSDFPTVKFVIENE